MAEFKKRPEAISDLPFEPGRGFGRPQQGKRRPPACHLHPLAACLLSVSRRQIADHFLTILSTARERDRMLPLWAISFSLSILSFCHFVTMSRPPPLALLLSGAEHQMRSCPSFLAVLLVARQCPHPARQTHGRPDPQ